MGDREPSPNCARQPCRDGGRMDSDAARRRALPPLRHADSTTLTLALSLKSDVRLLGFSFMLCLASTLLAGLPAAMQAMRADLHSAMKQGRSGGGQRLRWGLVMLQAGLCTLL